MRVAFFEDHQARQFAPLSLLRPVFELLCGHFTVRDRMLRALSISEWGVFCREELAESYAEAHPEAHVNDANWLKSGPTLLVNGRWLADPSELGLFPSEVCGKQGDELAWLILQPEEAALLDGTNLKDVLQRAANCRPAVPVSGTLAEHPWDLVLRNGDQLSRDFQFRYRNSGKLIPPGQVAIIGSPDQVYIDPLAEIDPFVVIDCRKGPVWIEAGVVLQAFTRLEGPAFVGAKSQLFRTNLREGTSIGPVCRVGGEVEGSILHGYVNKYHDGFLGHSYICPWVNLGALTTNSDLKNDYSEVKVPIAGELIPTGSKKVGCFIGDHTKTGLGSLFNTGTSVGVGCMILPGGELLPKHIPSFSRIWHGELAEGGDFSATLATARAAMERRNQTLTDAQAKLLQFVQENSVEERQKAIERLRLKTSNR